MFDFMALFRNKAYQIPMSSLASIPRATTELALGQEYQAHRMMVNSLSLFNTSSEPPTLERLKTLIRLDDSSQAFQQNLCNQYLKNLGVLKHTQEKLWQAVFSYYWQLAHGYQIFVKHYIADPNSSEITELVPLVTTRAMHYFAMESKWRYFRQEAVHPNMWKRLHKLYRLSESRRFAKSNILLNSLVGPSQCATEYARALLLEALHPLTLTPQQLELADRLISSWGKHIHIDKNFNKSKHEWYVELDSASGLLPAHPHNIGDKHRYLNINALLHQIQIFLNELHKGRLPANLKVGEAYEQPAYNELLHHMALRWTTGRARHLPRISRNAAVEVSCGVYAIGKSLLGEEDFQVQGRKDGWLLSAIPLYEGEQFVNTQRHAGGITLEIVENDKITVGQLVAIKQPAKNDRWSIGVIRRISKTTPQRLAVGVETLSLTPKLVKLINTSGAQIASDSTAVFLPRLDGIGIASSLILPISEFVTQRLLDLDDAKGIYRIRLAGVLEQSEDWVRVKFDILGRQPAI